MAVSNASQLLHSLHTEDGRIEAIKIMAGKVEVPKYYVLRAIAHLKGDYRHSRDHDYCNKEGAIDAAELAEQFGFNELALGLYQRVEKAADYMAYRFEDRIADLAMKTGDYETALARYEKLASHKEYRSFHEKTAQAAMLLGRKDVAITHYLDAMMPEEAIQLLGGPNSRDVRKRVEDLASPKGKKIRDFWSGRRKKAEARDLSDEESQNVYRAGILAEAADMTKWALEIFTYLNRPREASRVAEKLGRIDQAIDLMENYPLAAAEIAERHGIGERALKLRTGVIEDLIKKGADQWSIRDHQALVNAGRLAEEFGFYDKAITVAEKLRDYSWLASLCEKAERYEEAVVYNILTVSNFFLREEDRQVYLSRAAELVKEREITLTGEPERIVIDHLRRGSLCLNGGTRADYAEALGFPEISFVLDLDTDAKEDGYGWLREKNYEGALKRADRLSIKNYAESYVLKTMMSLESDGFFDEAARAAEALGKSEDAELYRTLASLREKRDEE